MKRTIFQLSVSCFPHFMSPIPNSGFNKPLPSWRRFLLLVLFLWWRVFVALVFGNYVLGGIIVLVQQGLDGLLRYLTSWALLAPLERSQPVLFGSLLTIVVLLAPVSFLAERRFRVEELERVRRSEWRLGGMHQIAGGSQDVVQTVIDKHLIRFDAAQSSPIESLLPPSDDALLPSPPHFVNRIGDLEWLMEQLSGKESTSVVTLGGLAGIGKTALAVVAVRKLREAGRFRDGIAVIFCQEFTNAIDILKRVLARFDPQRHQAETNDLTTLAEIAHYLLDNKDALVILDNVEPDLVVEKVVVPLHATGTVLLLTTQQSLAYDAIPLEASRVLNLLSLQEAMDLFALSLGRGMSVKLTPREQAAAARIVIALDHHTLSIKLAGTYAANAHRDLEELAREFEEDPHRAIEVPEGASPRAVELVFSRSTERLSSEVQQLFAALSVFRTVEFSRRAALALAKALALTKSQENLDVLVLRGLLDASTRADMPEESDRERLRMHPLLRTFAASRFYQWTEQERIIAHRAIANYYSIYVNKAPIESLGVDETNITGSLEWSYDWEEHELVVSLCSGMKRFWNERGRTAESLRYLPWGMLAAEAIVKVTGERSDRLRAADLALAYGQVHRPCGRVDEVEQIFKDNLAIRRELHDRHGEGVVLTTLGQSVRRRGQLQEAEDYLQQALAIAREVQNRHNECLILDAIGRISRRRGQLEEAERYFQEALKIARAVQNRREQGVVLISLGQVDRDQGRMREAVENYQEALMLISEVQDRRVEGAVLTAMGQISQYYGEMKQAEQHFRDALTIARDLLDRSGEGIALSRLGELARDKGQLEEAQRCYEQSLALHREMQGRRDEGVVLGLLGQLEHARGRLEEAEHYYEQSLVIRREVEDRRGEGVMLADLGLLAEDLGHPKEAKWHYQQGLDILRGQDAVNYAAALLAYGAFLIEHQEEHDEGCTMLLEAVQLYAKMGLPNEKVAREKMQRLGCKERGQEFS
jgi:tetratricopeptide (TPR) repeat protein